MFHFDDLTVLVLLPGIAGLMVLVGAGVVALLLRIAKAIAPRALGARTGDGDPSAWARRARTRYVLLAMVFWLALSIYLILDLAVAASVYLRFALAYAGFWTLIGALLLYDHPPPRTVLILGLFVVAVLSVRSINWNSRKPFLKDLYRIRDGMTPAQVDQIMSGYMRGSFGGPLGSHVQYQLDQDGEIVSGHVTYRHTQEGWGNSDWGTVAFEDGRVVGVEFLPD